MAPPNSFRWVVSIGFIGLSARERLPHRRIMKWTNLPFPPHPLLLLQWACASRKAAHRSKNHSEDASVFTRAGLHGYICNLIHKIQIQHEPIFTPALVLELFQSKT